MITFFIEKFKQWFCRHDFRIDEGPFKLHDDLGNITRQGTKISMLCPRCGYHKSFWKY